MEETKEDQIFFSFYVSFPFSFLLVFSFSISLSPLNFSTASYCLLHSYPVRTNDIRRIFIKIYFHLHTSFHGVVSLSCDNKNKEVAADSCLRYGITLIILCSSSKSLRASAKDDDVRRKNVSNETFIVMIEKLC